SERGAEMIRSPHTTDFTRKRQAMRFLSYSITALLLAASAGVLRAGAADDKPIPQDRPKAASAADYVPVPPPSAEALRYYHSGNVLWLINTAWGILIPCLFLFTGLSARIRSWAKRIGRKWFFTIGLYFLILWLVLYIIDWPLNYYEGFIRPHAYGLSNQTFSK